AYEDNQAVLAIIAKGYSPKLKHLAKFHRINVASTCEAFSVEDILIEYISTSHQKADVMNKALPVSVEVTSGMGFTCCLLGALCYARAKHGQLLDRGFEEQGATELLTVRDGGPLAETEHLTTLFRRS
ncbi:unnamed protein product, partial [Cladocopium goreaui]